MRWTILLIILIGILAPTLGCGGLSQEDLKKRASRPWDDIDESQEEEKPAVAESTSAKEEEDSAPPAKAAVNKTSPAKAPAPAAKTAAVKQTQVPEQASSADQGKTIAAKPQETSPSKQDPVIASAVTDDFPSSTSVNVSADASLAKADTDRRVIEENEDPFEKHAREYRERRAAERNREAQAKPGRGTTSTVSDKLAAITPVPIEDLFSRLVNPEKFIPEEYLRVAQELAQMGASTEALAYYNAWAITTEKPEEWLEQAKWSSALRRPAAALHVGVGVEYSCPQQWLSKAQPIGSQDRTFSGLKRDKTNADLKRYTGELSDRLLIGLDERNAEGNLGSLFQPDPVTAKSKRRIVLKWQAQPAGFKPESLGPGITYLGSGKKKELLYIADLQNVDILVIFEMNLRQPRSGPMINTTTVKLIDARTKGELNSTRGLNNIRIAFERKDRSTADPVEKEFQELFAYVDDSLQLTPFPISSIKPEHAAGRVEELASGEYTDPLPILAEMRLYFAQGLIDEAKLLESYQALVGAENAKLLVRGTVPQRVSMVAEHLPKIESAR